MGVAIVGGLILGVFGFDFLVQEAHRPSQKQIAAANSYLAAQGKDYTLSDCKIPLSGDVATMNCRAETESGRTVRLSFGFTPEGTVAVVCQIGTEGCDGQG